MIINVFHNTENMIKHDNPRLQNIILSKTQINNKEI